jgi:hypothetical protein
VDNHERPSIFRPGFESQEEHSAKAKMGRLLVTERSAINDKGACGLICTNEKENRKTYSWIFATFDHAKKKCNI